MPSLETVLICESSWETPDEEGLLHASKVLDVVGIQQPGSPTLWTYGMKPTGHELESPLILPAEKAARLAEYFNRYFTADPLRHGRRNCLGFAAFMQGWINEGHTWGSNDIYLVARQVAMTDSVPGDAYAFYGSYAPIPPIGMQHAVVGLGVDDCLEVESFGGNLMRKPLTFASQERMSDTYCHLSLDRR